MKLIERMAEQGILDQDGYIDVYDFEDAWMRGFRKAREMAANMAKYDNLKPAQANALCERIAQLGEEEI